ncbi:MAG: GNAT family N-acetyltransferase [Brumimicrobium sp.]|nr:GNAT family N-acetyltransferase [Brumimicrobium sp.]
MCLDIEKLQIRAIRKEDNSAIAQVIKSTLEEYGENKEGTVYTDPTTNLIYESFHDVPKSQYFIAEYKSEVIGGSGIYPTIGLPDKYAELVKIYLKPEFRGKGIGKLLYQKAEEFARKNGYSHLYLESFPSLKEAIHLYEKLGYRYMPKALGNSGHFACTVWMLKELKDDGR